jgi:hypothetical protein
MRFRSKIDVWLGVLIIAVASMISRAAWLIALKPYGFIEALLLVSIGAVLPIWILFSTGYGVSNKNLWVHSGPFRWKIPILSISKIEPSRSWMSSPALSINRFKIEYGRGKMILVSPKKADKFLYAIRESMVCGSI